MEKLNIVELLRDCPTGMELDCTMFEDMYFDHISDCGKFIYCYINYEDRKTSISFNKYGAYCNLDKAKCVLFPKGKNTWEGFVPPCKFKDGDIVASLNSSIYIFTNCSSIVDGYFFAPCGLIADHKSENHHFKVGNISISVDNMRLASEKEKQKLFDAIKENGYEWNPESKTLKKLISPIFKKGDKVRVKNGVSEPRIIDGVFDTFYSLVPIGKIDFTDQNNWELVPNIKFDINTLKPFESKVLVRHSETSIWMPAIFGGYDIPNLAYYVVGGTWWKYCIPYKCNEHLRGTTADCSNYYKTWE